MDSSIEHIVSLWWWSFDLSNDGLLADLKKKYYTRTPHYASISSQTGGLIGFIKLILVVCLLVGPVPALALGKRSRRSALTPLETIPPTCQPQCVVLVEISNLATTDMSIYSDICTSDTTQELQDCVVCFERESPSTFSPDLLTTLQMAADQLFTKCLLIGIPVPSVLIPIPTGDTSSIPTTPTSSAVESSTSGVIIPIVAVVNSYTTPSSASRTAGIAGGVAGGIVGLIFFAVILFWSILRRRKQSPKADKDTPSSGQVADPERPLVVDA